jgi:type II secretory pathway pseudopilin PulG
LIADACAGFAPRVRDREDDRSVERLLQRIGAVEVFMRLRTVRPGGARCRAADRRKAGGFALVEVLISVSLLVAVAVGVSQLAAAGVRTTHAARVRTVSTILAAQKMEQLRSLGFAHEWIGSPAVSVPTSDAWTDVSSELPNDLGPGLLPSPPGSLESNVAFYVDYLDAAGRWVGRDAAPPPDAVYVRRWAVRPLAADPDNMLVLHVVVASRASMPAGRLPVDATHLVTIRTRR